MRHLFWSRHTPFVLVGGATASVVEGINTAVVALLGVLLLITKWRFFRLLRGEKKLAEDK